MLSCIMRWINRDQELMRLDSLARRRGGGLGVVYGRRRLGKTRLLLEWLRKQGGLYTVADQSSADIQRRYFAGAVAEHLPGFAEVQYPDWRSLLGRLAREAPAQSWRGPLVIDELPYLVTSSPELPSVLQHWIDHDVRAAGLVLVIAGSSQRMMQGLVLSGDAPLYGRAQEILELRPMHPRHLREALGIPPGRRLVEAFACWGGVPRYWELAAEVRADVRSRVDRLVLDPLGALHREPDRLLIEELPPAAELRPILDAIGSGSHRVSEIGARVGRPATSISRPLGRLLEMGLVRREVPFGELERKSRRSLYKIDDPFFRLWFRVVAPHRGLLAAGSRRTRLALLDQAWSGLVAEAWENLCRTCVAQTGAMKRLGKLSSWKPASRWWRGSLPEWDIVSESEDGKRLLLGEARWSTRPLGKTALEREVSSLMSKPPPLLPRRYAKHQVVRALFVPELAPGMARHRGAVCVTAEEVVR